MLKSISVSNYILIDNWTVDFHQGLNVITGETGAGKSILISAIDNALGGKCSKDVIKTGEERAVLELTVCSANPDIAKVLKENEIEIDGNEFVITREITPTTSKYRIDGMLVNQNVIKDLRSFILDIHSQHQSYTFLQKKYHIKLLDSYVKTTCAELLNEYSQKYKEYTDLKKKLVDLKNQSQMTEAQIDFLKFQIDEIEGVNIQDVEEDEKLNRELAVLENAEKLKELTGGAYWALSNDDNSITAGLSNIKMNISKAVQLDESLKDAEGMLIEANEILRELSSTLRDYSQNMDNDTARLNEIQERLFELDKLKRKYG
ncbi:MAG: AAA family ATPase, partial [Cyanobacteria bacterium RUI128]|nr:AAA family ATPase [Cyanobacteria bacterium RUI128]